MNVGHERRGGPLPNGLEWREASLLGPYPTWRAWRHVVEERFRLDLKDSHNPDEPDLHELYCLRRLQQKKDVVDRLVMETFWAEVEEKNPGFEKRWADVIRFIIEKTETRPVK